MLFNFDKKQCKFCKTVLSKEENADICFLCRDQLQIDFLNNLIKIYLAPSQIHGVGLFALKNIKKGERLYADIFPQPYKIPYHKFTRLKPEIANLILSQWPQVATGEGFMWPTVFLQAYINHSDNFNYDSRSDTMIKDVDKDCEITENYRAIKGWGEVFPWLKPC